MRYLIILFVVSIVLYSCNSTKNTQVQTSEAKQESKEEVKQTKIEETEADNIAPIQNTPPPNTADEAIMTSVDDMANKLNLSDAKKKKLKSLSWIMVNDLKKIRTGETSVDRSEKGKALIAVINQYKTNVHQFLNEDQITLFDKLMSESREFLGPGMGRDWD